MTVNLQTLVSIGSLLGVLIAVYKVYKYKEAAMQQQGKQQEKQRQVEDELLLAKKRIEDLQERLGKTDVNMATIQADIKHIMDALGRIEDKLDDHIGKGTA